MGIIRDNPTIGFKYWCDNCEKRFNWDKNSCRYGKAEYKTIQEQEEKEKHFCTDECYNEYFKSP